jgi:transposase
MEDWVTIKTLKAKNSTMSLREIGRLVHHSPHTVKAALTNEEPPAYQRVEQTNENLAPFKEVIFEMANVKKFKGSRILNELRSKGYGGGKTAFYEFLAKIKLEQQRHCTPYETLPGEQAQFDWSPYTVLIANRLTKIIAFSYINAFSRYQIFDVALTEHQGAVFEALENALHESHGVPQRLQTDNAKVFVTNASRSNFQWNERYLHFCGHYGFEPSRSLPGHPWSKGKVEKPFSFLETHFIAGSAFDDFDDLVRKLKAFQARVNTRVHATIRTTPEELIPKDREAFSALPPSRYVGVQEETRKVTADCLISFNGSRYSVPWMFAGKHIWIKVSKGYFLQMYSQANILVTTHTLSQTRGAVVIDKSHYRSQNHALTASFDRLRTLFLEAFPDQTLFLDKLHAQKRINARYHLAQLLEVAKLYHTDDVLAALKVSLDYNVFTVHFIVGVLERHQARLVAVSSTPSAHQIPVADVHRNLDEYRLAE